MAGRKVPQSVLSQGLADCNATPRKEWNGEAALTHCLNRGEKPSEVKIIRVGLRSYGMASATSDYSKGLSGCVYFEVFMLPWHFLTCALWTGNLFAFSVGYFLPKCLDSSWAPVIRDSCCLYIFLGCSFLTGFSFPHSPSLCCASTPVCLSVCLSAAGTSHSGLLAPLVGGWTYPFIQSEPPGVFSITPNSGLCCSGLPQIYLQIGLSLYFSIASLPSITVLLFPMF